MSWETKASPALKRAAGAIHRKYMACHKQAADKATRRAHLMIIYYARILEHLATWGKTP